MKLLIVDDESHVVEYIKHVLDWKSVGFNTVLGVSKSQQAMEILAIEKPDLMIADIQMPGLSGLDLTEEIVARKLPTKVIILSGYSDFSYAQRAIRLEIVDYLIKPITKRDLLPVVNRAVSAIKVFQSRRSLSLNERNLYFLERLNSFSFPEEDREKMVYIVSDAPHYKMLNLRIGDKFLTLLPKDSAQRYSEYHPMEVKQESLKNAFKSLLVPNSKQTLDHTKVELIKNKHWLELRDQLATAGAEQELGTQETIDLFWLLAKAFPQLLDSVDLSEFLNSDNQRNLFLDFLENHILLQEEPQEAKEYAEDTVRQILKYIQEHYNEELSLDQLAELFHMHPVTISKNFKAVTGGTFVNYLKKYRLGEAAKLLVHSNLMVADIGSLVGYKTARYFSDLFRKAYGMTPQSYRRKMQNKEGK